MSINAKNIWYIFVGVHTAFFVCVSNKTNARESPDHNKHDAHTYYERKNYILNVEELAQVRERIKMGDTTFIPAYKYLLSEANDALKRGPYTVLDKRKTPPSGDKLDYMSLSPYFWPDSTKKDFLPYVYRDGETNPEAYDGTYDKRRFLDFMEDTYILSLAYFFSEQDTYAKHAVLLLKTWFIFPETAMNPNMKYAQAVIGKREGTAAGMIDFSLRVYKILESVALLQKVGFWTNEEDKVLTLWFEKYLDWIATSKMAEFEANEKNNHGTWYDVHLVGISLYLGKTDRAQEILKRVKKKRIISQIAPDGSMPHELRRTKSFDYTLMNSHAFVMLAQYAESLEVDLWNYEDRAGRSLKKAIDYWLPFIDFENTTWPFNQIAAFEVKEFVQHIVQRASKAYKDSSYLSYLEYFDKQEYRTLRERLLFPVL